MKFLFIFCTVFLWTQPKITPQYIESELKKIEAVMETGNTSEYIKKNTAVLRDSKKINYSKGITISAVNLSNSYSLLGDYKKSLAYLELIKKEKYAADHLELQINIRKLYSFNYINTDLLQEGITELKAIIALSDEIKEDSMIILTKSMAYNDLGAVYLEKEQFDSASLAMKKAINTIEKSKAPSHKLKRLLIWYYLVLANVKIEEKKTDSAEIYVKIAEAHPGKILGNHNFKLYETKGRIHDQKREYEAAVEDYQKALKLAKKTNRIAAKQLYKLISDAYTNLGDKEAAKDYLHQYIALSDSLNNSTQLLAEKSINKLVENKEDKLQIRIWAIIYSVGAVIVGGIIFLFFILRKDHKKRLVLNQKDQETKQLNKKINTAFEEITQLAKNNAPEFLTKFQEAYPTFSQKLLQIEPQLQNSELKFCALLFLNFSSKDIATYTFVQPQSIQTRKNRLRKKLNISSEEDIYIWMKNMNNQ